MDTVSDAMRRLQAEGYTGNWYATPDGNLQCDQTGEVADLSNVQIDHVLRFEGQSDPGDEVILFALRSPSGDRGIYSAAFGPTHAGGLRGHRSPTSSPDDVGRCR